MQRQKFIRYKKLEKFELLKDCKFKIIFIKPPSLNTVILCTHILENPLNISMPNSQDLEKKPLMFVVPFSFCKGRLRRIVVFIYIQWCSKKGIQIAIQRLKLVWHDGSP